MTRNSSLIRIAVLCLIVFAMPANAAPSKNRSAPKQKVEQQEHFAPYHKPFKTSTNSAAVNAFKHGKALNDSGQYESAVLEFSLALRFDPHYEDARAERAGVYFFQLCDNNSALDDFNILVKANPGESFFLVHRARVLTVLRRYNEAIADFTKALQLDPHRYHIYRQRGDDWAGLGQWRKACDDYAKWCKIGGIVRDTDYFLLGDCHQRLGQLTEAIHDYDCALKLNQKDDHAYFKRADAYFKAGEYARAVEDYTQALSLDPESPSRVLEARARAYRKLGKFNLAARDSEAAGRAGD
ncbi:MAG: tetratricopeptide repeat protein [Terriglobales bacterium]